MTSLTATQHWLVENAYLLADRFGDDQVLVDSDNWSYLMIQSFYLPAGWYPCRTRLLLYFPSLANILTLPPEHFYLDPGLRTVSGTLPPHYYEAGSFNDLADCGFARFSFHIKDGWQPALPVHNGTTLLDALNWLDQGLSDAIKEAGR